LRVSNPENCRAQELLLLMAMPVSSLVLTLSSSAKLQHQVIEQLSANPGLTLGFPQTLATTQLLPVVLETESIWEAQSLAESIAEMPGVDQVELVGVDFSDLPETGMQSE
jgi:hypothetical protein